MVDHLTRRRITRFDDVRILVDELRLAGFSGAELYWYATDVAIVDLDMLNMVLAEQVAERA